ncbi:MAG: D-Ala-D-Ala carboxypeptidase family metallohydrolase [Myxococcota bacterium]
MVGETNWKRSGSLLAAALLLGACASEDGRTPTGWDPALTAGPEGSGGLDVDDKDTDAGSADATGDTGMEPEGDETGGMDPSGDTPGTCNPGMERQCLCDDGVHLGYEICNDAGDGWGPCVCDGSDPSGNDSMGDPTDDGGTTGGGDDVAPTEVCYPGADGSYNTCFDLLYVQPDGYDYPPALNGDPNYRQPIAYIDLEAIDPDTMIAPNFRLEEVAEAFKGRYGLVQPHAIESLQQLRDDVGAITVNSAYRPPEYNASVGGATHSRHMYGDGFDLDPVNVGLSTLEAACQNRGGMLVEYNTHVHCDFRFDDVSEEFFGAAGAPEAPTDLGFSATLQHEGAGVYTAPAEGFDEGEPLRRWSAYDADGELLDSAFGPVYVAPVEAARVRVVVGAQVERNVTR